VVEVYCGRSKLASAFTRKCSADEPWSVKTTGLPCVLPMAALANEQANLSFYGRLVTMLRKCGGARNGRRNRCDEECRSEQATKAALAAAKGGFGLVVRSGRLCGNRWRARGSGWSWQTVASTSDVGCWKVMKGEQEFAVGGKGWKRAARALEEAEAVPGCHVSGIHEVPSTMRGVGVATNGSQGMRAEGVDAMPAALGRMRIPSWRGGEGWGSTQMDSQ
jgi:hypothetical protein